MTTEKYWYITNPEHRCIHCNGREVLVVDYELEEVVDTNLNIVTDGELVGYECKNKKECSKNIKNESTNTFLQISDNKITGIEIEQNGKTIFKLNHK